MVIKGIPQLASPGWNPDWGPAPITGKIHLGIVVYQRWRYKTWGMDLKFLTLLKRVRLVWKPKSIWHSITFFSVKRDYKIVDYLQRKPTSGHIRNILRAKTTTDSESGEKSSE